jgi:pimeloyl-ACP methyl ester carboxylesterase
MADDEPDADTQLRRRCVWLTVCGFSHDGDGCSHRVFARVCGDPRAPLVLYVHGSGVHNSSRVWTDCMVDTARALLGATGTSYYHVAIDAPGYGRSPGDRQTIRSYPGAFLSAVVCATGRHRAAALVGSSQGACAVFNAALEVPRLSERLAVCHPVGHAVERYCAIRQHTLLAFDVHDAGHPVSVGRRMRAALPRTTYFEYVDAEPPAESGGWLACHFADELVALLLRAESPWPPHRGKERPELCTLAGGVRMWSGRHESECGPWYVDDGEPSEGACDAAASTALPMASSDAAAGAEQDDDEMGARRECVPCATPHVEADAEADGLFSDSELSDEDEAQAAEEHAAAAQLAAERAQTTCDLRGCSLGAQPLRLAACRHALCECCALRTVHLLSECPVCGMVVRRAHKRATGMPIIDADAITPQPTLTAELPHAEAQAEAARASAASALLYASASRTSTHLAPHACCLLADARMCYHGGRLPTGSSTATRRRQQAPRRSFEPLCVWWVATQRASEGCPSTSTPASTARPLWWTGPTTRRWASPLSTRWHGPTRASCGSSLLAIRRRSPSSTTSPRRRVASVSRGASPSHSRSRCHGAARAASDSMHGPRGALGWTCPARSLSLRRCMQ